jgi:hypothetical protein
MEEMEGTIMEEVLVDVDMDLDVEDHGMDVGVDVQRMLTRVPPSVF